MNIGTIVLASVALLSSSFALSAMATECGSAPILKNYLDAGMAMRSSAGGITISFNADTHFADCGAPDCYGTHVTIVINPSKDGLCAIEQVEVDTLGYNNCEDTSKKFPEEKQERVVETYFPSNGPLRLTEPNLTKITLYNQSKTKAVVILESSAYYFEEASPNGVLRAELQGEDDNGEMCCWGAAASRGQFESRSVGP